MTLFVAAGSTDYAVLVVDRRLTAGGGVRTDESNKLAMLVTSRCRLAVTFTGLAEAGEFHTNAWLPERLRDALDPSGVPSIERFCQLATEDLARVRVARPSELLLWIAFAGFVALPGESGRRLTFVLVSNCADDPEGRPLRFAPQRVVLFEPDSSERAFAAIGGAVSEAMRVPGRAIEALARSARPPEAVVGKGVELIQNVAVRDARVGTQCSSLVVHRDGSMTFGYHTARPTDRIYTPAVVTQTQVFRGACIVRRSSGPAAVPRAHRRALCSCRSGRRYEECHGRRSREGIRPTFDLPRDGSLALIVGDVRMSSDSESFVVNLLPQRAPRPRRNPEGASESGAR